MGLFGMAIMSSARIGTIDSLVGDKFEWATAPLPKVDAADTGGTAVGGTAAAHRRARGGSRGPDGRPDHGGMSGNRS